MPINFRKHAQKGEAFLNELALALGDPADTARAGRVLRAVLYTFRDRIPPVESLQLIAQLPLFIKAVYVDGWQIGHENSRIRHLDDFIQAVRQADGRRGNTDFTSDAEVEEAIHAVFRVIKSYVSEGEIEDVIAGLPMELRPLVAEA